MDIGSFSAVACQTDSPPHLPPPQELLRTGEDPTLALVICCTTCSTAQHRAPTVGALRRRGEESPARLARAASSGGAARSDAEPAGGAAIDAHQSARDNLKFPGCKSLADRSGPPLRRSSALYTAPSKPTSRSTAASRSALDEVVTVGESPPQLPQGSPVAGCLPRLHSAGR